MDPVTTIGAIAACTQLVAQLCSIIQFFSELRGQLKDASRTTRSRASHLQQLLSVAQAIEKTKSLQTPEIYRGLQSCVQVTLELDELLKAYSIGEKGKLRSALQSWNMVRKENKVHALLDKIEKEKSFLMLCIHQVDATQLESLNITVTDVKLAITMAARKIDDAASSAQKILDLHPETSHHLRFLRDDVRVVLGKVHLQNIVAVIVFTLAILMGLWWTLYPSISSSSVPEVRQLLYEVPNRRVRDFVGREDVLHHIDIAFRNSSTVSGPTIVVLTAMGGQGKTQVALEYCRRYRKMSDIFWFDASSAESLKSSFASLGTTLDPTSSMLDAETLSRITRRMLTSRPEKWLTVFDNYDDPSSFDIRQYIPENDLGRVIVTSRHRDTEYLAEETNRIRLSGLETADAVQLLLFNCEIIDSDSPVHDHATAIVNQLACHPLAIAQAGAYINVRKLPLQEFLSEFANKKEAILKYTNPRMSDYYIWPTLTDPPSQMTVFTTCELSYQHLLRLERKEEVGLSIYLTLLSFFESRDISLKLYQAYCMEEFAPGWKQPHLTSHSYEINTPLGLNLCKRRGRWDPDFFHTAFDMLSQLSLIELTPNRMKDGFRHASLHPLIKEWLQWRTSLSLRWGDYTALATACTLRLLHSSYYSENLEVPFLNMTRGEQALERSVFGSTKVRMYYPADGASRSVKFCLLPHPHKDTLLAGRRGTSSRTLHQRMMTDKAIEDGSKNAHALSNLNTLATLLEWKGSFIEAHDIEHLYRQVIYLGLSNYEEGEPRAWTFLARLARTLPQRDRVQEAEKVQRELLRLLEKHVGEQDLDTIVTMGYLGYLLKCQDHILGKLEESEAITRRALSLAQNYFGLENIETIRIMGFLGSCLSKMEKLEEAETLLRALLDVGQKQPENVDWNDAIRDATFDLGLVCFSQQKFEEANSLFWRYWNLSAAQYGRANPRVIMFTSNAAELFQSKNQTRASESWRRLSLQLHVDNYGMGRNSTFKAMSDLASVLESLGKIEDAITILDDAVIEGTKSLTPRDPLFVKLNRDLTRLRDVKTGQRPSLKAPLPHLAFALIAFLFASLVIYFRLRYSYKAIPV